MPQLDPAVFTLGPKLEESVSGQHRYRLLIRGRSVGFTQAEILLDERGLRLPEVWDKIAEETLRDRMHAATVWRFIPGKEDLIIMEFSNSGVS